METPGVGEVDVSVQDIVDFMRITDEFDDYLQRVVRRKVCAQAARQVDLEVSEEELQEAADTFRRLHGLHSAPETENWIRNAGLTLEDLEQHLEENLLIYKWKQKLLDETDLEEEVESSADLRETITSSLLEQWFQESFQGIG